MPLHPDSRLVLIFYSTIALSLLIFNYLAAEYELCDYGYIGLGSLWAVCGVFFARRLQHLYASSFWKMRPREQKFIAIALLVASLGFFLVIWSMGRILN
jgi:O-antigen/teichoic acid export membrane protein